MSERPRKAVIPAAGLGTRFLPVTKSLPKEMLPIVDRPAIQYVVEEAVRAGLPDVLVVTSRGKQAIEDHFDRNIELEGHLEGSDRAALLTDVQAVTEMASIHYVRQREPLGLGHAVSVARDHVGAKPFAVLLPDDLLLDDSEFLAGMIETSERFDASVIALLEVSSEEIGAYGCATVEPVEDGLVRVRDVVEKPDPAEAPSNLAVIGRYVFTAEIFDELDRVRPGHGGELQLTDAFAALARTGAVYGRVLEEARLDVGNKPGFLRANLEFALRRPDLADEVRALLEELLGREDG